MTVTIIRHGKVIHTWKKSCTSAEFDQECSLYNSAPIEKMAPYSGNAVQKIYISTMDRAYQTAKELFGDREFIRCELIGEVPLGSSRDTNKKLPLWYWNVTGRLQWLIGSKRQQESREQTMDRAERFAQQIIESNEDCAIVTHGFFMHTLIGVMKRYGFKPETTRVSYKNGEAVVLEK